MREISPLLFCEQLYNWHLSNYFINIKDFGVWMNIQHVLPFKKLSGISSEDDDTEKSHDAEKAS